MADENLDLDGVVKDALNEAGALHLFQQANLRPYGGMRRREEGKDRYTLVLTKLEKGYASFERYAGKVAEYLKGKGISIMDLMVLDKDGEICYYSNLLSRGGQIGLALGYAGTRQDGRPSFAPSAPQAAHREGNGKKE